jgi:putative two-component system response regulator
VGIPDAILLKPGALTAEEARAMQQHTTIGGRILAGGRSPLMSLAEAIALSHHERWDGYGYPEGLREERIPIAARIVSIADVYDALTTARPYRPAWTRSAALEVIRAGAGKQFDPELVRAFLRLRSV